MLRSVEKKCWAWSLLQGKNFCKIEENKKLDDNLSDKIAKVNSYIVDGKCVEIYFHGACS